MHFLVDHYVLMFNFLYLSHVWCVQVLIRSRCEKRLRVLQSPAIAGVPLGTAPGATGGQSATDVLPVASHTNIVPFSFPHDESGSETLVSLCVHIVLSACAHMDNTTLTTSCMCHSASVPLCWVCVLGVISATG